MKKAKKFLCNILFVLLIAGIPIISGFPDSLVEVQAASMKVTIPKHVSAKASGT